MAEKKEVSERDKYFYIRSNFVKLYQQAYYNKVYINENDKSIIDAGTICYYSILCIISIASCAPIRNPIRNCV